MCARACACKQTPWCGAPGGGGVGERGGRPGWRRRVLASAPTPATESRRAEAAPGPPRSTALPIGEVRSPRRGGDLRPGTTSPETPRLASRRGGGLRGSQGRRKRAAPPRAWRRCVGGASAGSLRAGCPGGVCLPDSGSMNPSPLLREPVTGCKCIPSNPRGPAQARRPRRRGSGPLRSHPGCQQASQLPRGNLRRGQGWPGTWRELRGSNQRLAGAVSTCRERRPPSVTSKS